MAELLPLLSLVPVRLSVGTKVDGAGERQDRVSGEPARKQSVHGGGDVKPLRLASSSSAEQQSTSHE